MAETLSPNLSVRHGKYGDGTVQLVFPNQGSAWVYFKLLDDSKLVPAAELKILGEGTPVKQFNTPTTQEDRHGQKRLVLECLRQGLPPTGKMEEWTVGFQAVRKDLQKAIRQAALENRGKVFIIEAGYGGGKTHMGQWAMETALKEGLLVMDVDFDGKSLTPSNGARLLSHLFASARLSGTAGHQSSVPGLGSLLNLVSDRLQNDWSELPRILEEFRPILDRVDEWRGDEEAVEILEQYLSGELSRIDAQKQLLTIFDQKIDLPALKLGWGPLADKIAAQTKQLQRIMNLGRVAGAKATLIVMDEFDHILKGKFDQKAELFLDSLCRLTRVAPLIMLWLTPSSSTMGFPNCQLLRLPELNSSELKQLTFQAITAYREAYPNRKVPGDVEKFFLRLWRHYKKDFENTGWGPRFFVRSAVEACDGAAKHCKNLEELL